MLKQRYRIFLIVFVLILLIGVWLSTRNPYSYATQPLSEKHFTVSQEDTCSMDLIPLWFTFKNGDAVLHTEENIGENTDEICFLYPDSTVGTEKVSDFQYTDEMMGDLLVCAKKTMTDLDMDGVKETVLACAKSQTLISQGYDAYAYYNHTFGDETVPVEITYGGSTNLTTDITVLVYGTPYTGTIRLQSAAGLDRTMDITDGVVSGCRISDLRQGVSVLIQDEENDRILAGSYIVEDYPMFSKGYFSGLSNMFLLFAIIIGGGLLISAGRYLIRRREYAV